jgi:DNA-binding transcriptional LysR family regulator
VRFGDSDVPKRITKAKTHRIAENIDLAIRIGNLQDSQLVGRKLCDNPVVMVASPKFLELYGEPKNMQALATTPCVTYESKEVAVDNWIYLERGREKVVKVQSGFKTSDGQLLLDACIAGYGVALLPTYGVLSAIQSEALKVVLPKIKLKDYQAIYLVYASRQHQSPALREFLNHIQLWIQQHPIPQQPKLFAE